MQQNHSPFHLVESSPWPFLASMSILFMPAGLVYYIRGGNLTLLILGIISTGFISFLWWRDVARESTKQGLHTSLVTRGLKLGVLLFIVSEVLFFFGFFWAYYHSSLAPSIQTGGTWPPFGVITLNPFQVPLLNTSVLLLSGVSITWAHHSIEEGCLPSALKAMLITLLLGFYFVWLQYGEYAETSFTIADSIYGSCFFLATGFHGLHVIVGAVFIMVTLFRMAFMHFDKSHHIGFLAAAWYWHFVDVVWLFLYISIYWWGSYSV